MIRRMVMVGVLATGLAFSACGGSAMTVDGLADQICSDVKAVLAKPAGEQAAAFAAVGEKVDKDAAASKLDPQAVGAVILQKCGPEFMQAAALAP